MNLSRRTALILTLTSLLGLGGMAVVSGVVLDDAFSGLEAEDAERDLDRVEAAVQSDLDDLAWTATQFTDLAGLLVDDDPAGSSERINRSAGLIASLLQAGDLDAVAASSSDGVWLAWNVDLARIGGGLEAAFQNATPALSSALAQEDPAHADPLRPHSTILQVDDDVYLVGARAVTTLDPGNTTVIATLRLVDDEYLEGLSVVTSLDVGAAPTNGVPPQELRRSGFSTWTATRGVPSEAPVLDLQVTGERDIYQQGVLAFLFVVGGAALISALLLGASLMAMRATVTGRLHSLADRVAEVRGTGDLSARVGIAGHDELAELSHEFDLMLADLEGRSDELKRSNEELGAFASVVSHDLKSPLSTFTMNLAVMKRVAERDGEEKQLERVARMERTVATMQGRIEAVLEYSRAGRKPKRNAVPLDDVARTVLEDVEANLVEADARVELEPLPSVRGDRQALSQVLQNLIQNAVKYRRPDVPPRVRVHARETEDGGMDVVVEDNGRGFRQEDAERMLQPFQRLDNAGDAQGHGVGLATCLRIMQAHDGGLHAEGEEGVGARMSMHFPAPRVLAPPTAARTSMVGGFKKALEERSVKAQRKREAEAAEREDAAPEAPEARAEPAEPEPAAAPSPPQEAAPEETFQVVDEEPPPRPARRRRRAGPRPERGTERPAAADRSAAHAPTLAASAPRTPAPEAPGDGPEDWRTELEARFGARPERDRDRPDEDDGDDATG